MKRINKILVLGMALAAVSCNLDYFPGDGYNEGNVDVDDSDFQYRTKEDIQGALTNMYNNIRGSIQEAGYLDLLVVSEVLADNAYNGNPSTPEIVALEGFSHDADNKNISRDWSYYMARVTDANQIITYIDGIEDAALTDAERKQWKAEAMIWRAWTWFQMSLMWGDVPMVEIAPPVLTAENIDEVYPLYYPDRIARETVFNKIAEDVEWAAGFAPALDNADKFRMSKAVAYGLLARVYAEAPIQDYSKVDEYCSEVESTGGLALVDDFSELWAYGTADVVKRHSSESIFEIPFTPSSGNWVWMMFWRNGLSSNPDDSFDWAKWICPSRNLVEAYGAEGDAVRYEQTVVWDTPKWSTKFYDNDNYPFMYKTRSNAASIIRMRLAEIYLLHAEALAQLDRLDEAADYVDQVRDRAGLAALPAGAQDSKEAMLEAVLHERRLELAFEGHRWFDLKRLGKAVECVNGRGDRSSSYYDSHKPAVTIDERKLLLPIPGSELDNNKNLEQNPGF